MVNTVDHEAKCKRCGDCCRLKLLTMPGRAIAFHKYCHYYDAKHHRCKVYENRHEVNPHCKDVEYMIRIRALPNHCAYVQDVPGYKSRCDYP